MAPVREQTYATTTYLKEFVDQEVIVRRPGGSDLAEVDDEVLLWDALRVEAAGVAPDLDRDPLLVRQLQIGLREERGQEGRRRRRTVHLLLYHGSHRRHRGLGRGTAIHQNRIEQYKIVYPLKVELIVQNDT